MLISLAGIFVGGQSRRLDGIPKGLLQPPGTTSSIVERLVAHLGAAGVSQVVLVGKCAAYREPEWSMIADSPLGCGPMAGLLGLAEHAVERGIDQILAIACDMPFVDEAFLRRLCEEQPNADALVPRRERWEPLCARYRARAIMPHLQRLLGEGRYRMTDLLDALGGGCIELGIDSAQASILDDWDCTSDLPPGVRVGGKPLPPGVS